jgi:hypothetical protein
LWFSTTLTTVVFLWTFSFVSRLTARLFYSKQVRQTPTAGQRSYSAALQWLVAIAVFAVGYWLISAIPAELIRIWSMAALQLGLACATITWLLGGLCYLVAFRLDFRQRRRASVAVIAVTLFVAILPGALQRLNLDRMLSQSSGGLARFLAPFCGYALASFAATLIVSVLVLRLASTNRPSGKVSRYGGTLVASLIFGLVLATCVQLSGLPLKIRFHLIRSSDDPEFLLTGLQDADGDVSAAAAHRIWQMRGGSASWTAERRNCLRDICVKILAERYGEATWSHSQLLGASGADVAPILIRGIRGQRDNELYVAGFYRMLAVYHDRFSVEQFQQWVTDEHPHIRRTVLRHMMGQPELARRCAMQLRSLPADEDDHVRHAAAACALRHLPEFGPEILATLYGNLHGGSLDSQERALSLMETQFERYPETKTSLVTAAQKDCAHEEPGRRSASLLILHAADREDEQAWLPHAQAALDDPDPGVRRVAQTLVGWGEQDQNRQIDSPEEKEQSASNR